DEVSTAAPPSESARITARSERNAPSRLTDSTRRHSAKSSSAIGAPLATPALITASSSGASFGSRPAHMVSSETSPVTRSHVQGSSSASRPASSRSTSTSRAAPPSASMRAHAAPMPEAAPVLSADLPANAPSPTMRAGLGLSGGVVDAEIAELAVKRRPADPEPPSHFGHAPAIMPDREPDHIGFDLFQRTQIAVLGIEHHPRALGFAGERLIAAAIGADDIGQMRKVIGRQRVAVAMDGCAEQDCLQLADIARPVE